MSKPALWSISNNPHAAATVLLILGVPARTAMEIMNWSSTSTTKRYQNVTDPIRKAVAEQVGGLLLASSEEPANIDERGRMQPQRRP